MTWARLRQVILAAPDVDTAAAQLRERLGVERSFADPQLDEVGLRDVTFPLGPDHYVQVVSPVGGDGPLGRWLERTGGPGGYCLSVQIPDAAAARARAVERGVRITLELEAFGEPVMQLHPKDVGVLLELDRIAERDRWFWDDLTPGPTPTAYADRIESVTVGVPDPEQAAALWAYVLDVGRPTPTSVDLGARVEFVEGRGLAGLAVRGTAQEGPLLGVDLRVVPE